MSRKPVKQPRSPLVSVIVPLKNGLPRWRSVVDMLSRQEIDGGFEIIVIDSGSSDGSKEIIPLDDPRFRLIEIEPSSFGHGKTRNLGVDHARGEFCAFLTHDATPLDANWLSELIKPLLEDPNVAGVFGRHVAYPEASPYTTWELEAHFGGLRAFPKVKITDARAYAKNQGLRQVYHFYSDNSSCLRKSVWKRFPYPDVDFAEDQLWAKQIVEAGYSKAFAWDSVVAHSHDYSIWERLQRSYDESRAFRRLFGYRLCTSRSAAVRQALKTTARDFKLARQGGWVFSHPIATFRQPFDNLARQIGYYLGARDSGIGARYEQTLSRDKRIQAK